MESRRGSHLGLSTIRANKKTVRFEVCGLMRMSCPIGRRERAARPGVVILLALLLTACGGPPELLRPAAADIALSAVDEASRPCLDGVWLINRQLSDDATERLADAIEGGRKSRRFAEVSRAMGIADSTVQTLARRAPVVATARPARLVVRHREPTIVFGEPGPGQQRLYTDFRGASVSALGGSGQRVVTAGWQQQDLIVETATAGGQRLVERFSVEDGDGSAPRRLLLTRETVLRDGRRDATLSVRLVYEADVASSATGDCPSSPPTGD